MLTTMFRLIFLFGVVVVTATHIRAETLTSQVSTFNITNDPGGTNEVSLSRKKRFLVFPEGSSLQLVYCLTMPSIAMADFFVFGWTAAIAWELPNKPFIGVHKKKEDEMPVEEKEEESHENHPNSRIDIDHPGKFYYPKKKSPYSTLNKLGVKIPPSTYSTILQLLNKNFQKSSWGTNGHYEGDFGDRVTMYHDPVYREVHRRTRRDLYPKIEKFLSMQQKDGKACLLKAICEVTKLSKGKEKGSFMQELMKVLFRVKEFQHPKDQKDKYDEAANEEHNCDEIYPTCDSSIFSLF